MLPALNTKHVEEAKALLTDQFKGRANIEGILTSWIQQFQDLENVYWQILNGRTLPDAIGVQLDMLGNLVGEPRNGRGDDEYRAAIALRIRINRANGTPEDILEIVSLLTDNLQYDEYYPADFILTIFFDDLAQYRPILAAVRQIKPAGVGATLVAGLSPPEETITWGHTSGSYGLGWAHTDGLPRRVEAHVEKIG